MRRNCSRSRFQVVSQHDEAMRRFSQMIKKLSRHCHVFQSHSEQSRSPGPSQVEKETCFEMFISMTKFFANALQFFREVGDMSLVSQARGNDACVSRSLQIWANKSNRPASPFLAGAHRTLREHRGRYWGVTKPD